MVTLDEARKEALALPETEEKSHFNQPDFRVKNKIFAVLHADKNVMMVKLSLVDQNVFCSYNPEIIFPVPGGWGRSGSTFIHLRKIKKAMFKDALLTAWKTVAPIKMVEKYFGKS